MTGIEQIVAGLEAAEVSIVAPVPDTWIGRVMVSVRRSPRLRAVDVAREEEAVAVACGANLAGGRGAVLIVVEVAFDPAEAIPPYSERPDEIRARFRLWWRRAASSSDEDAAADESVAVRAVAAREAGRARGAPPDDLPDARRGHRP
jgi:hypothetical protein